MKLKKLIWTLLLACCFLLPACEIEDTGSSTSGSNGGSHVENADSTVGGDNDYDGEHVDSNDDGICDECNTSVTVNFDIFAVNDLHGKFLDTDAQPGVDEMSTYIQNAREENPNTIVLSSGDMWQGSPESNLTRGAILVDWMNEMDFSAMTLGNHEYDWGEQAIIDNSKIAEFPFLGINVYDKTTNQRVDYCQPSKMVEMGDVKIGIIGAEGDVLSSISSDKVENIEFKTGSQLTNLVMAESQKLRSEGADCIIYSIHDGTSGSFEHYDQSLSQGGYVDIVFEGHAHQWYTRTDSYGVYHVQGGGDNQRGLSHAEISVNYVNSSAKVVEARQVSHSECQALPDHPVVESLKTKYKSVIDTAYEVLGTNDKIRSSNEILTAVAQLYYEAAEEKWGNEYDIVLGGGYLGIRAPYDLAAGNVIYGDLINLMPFDNPLVLCSIKGSDLKRNFIQRPDDWTKYYTYYGEYGTSVKDTIVDSATYYVVVDKYSSTYAPNKLTEIEVYDESTFARDLYAEYIRQGNLTTQVKTITIAEAQQIGGALAAGATTDAVYRVQGEIIEIEPFNEKYQKQFGNMTIKDGAGNTLYIYGSKDAQGVAFNDMESKPQVGDYVLLEQALTRYVNGTADKVEMTQATILSVVKISTISQINEMGNALGDNEKTATEYGVWGTVKEITSTKYGNMLIEDEAGNTLYIYGSYDMAGNRYDASTIKPQVGDKVFFVGKILKYVNENGSKIEIENAVVREIV